MESSDAGAIGKGGLIELQERDNTLSNIEEKVYSL